MRNIQFTEAQAAVIVKLLAEKWAAAACYAAVDHTARIWNDPGNGIGRVRRKWYASKTSEAAMFAKMLWAFGIDTPAVDTASYFKPASPEYRSKYYKPGDMEFMSSPMFAYRKELIARMLGEPLPTPSSTAIPEEDRKVASAMLKALNTEMRKHL